MLGAVFFCKVSNKSHKANGPTQVGVRMWPMVLILVALSAHNILLHLHLTSTSLHNFIFQFRFKERNVGKEREVSKCEGGITRLKRATFYSEE